MPVLASLAAAGSTSQVIARVFQGAGQSVSSTPLTESRLSISIDADPETTLATLFGRVFIDANGNGDFDAGEAPVSGATIGLAAGIYAVTDDTGRYHIEGLSPGRHVVKVDRAGLVFGARFSSPQRRTLTLSSGMFSKLNFAIALPQTSPASAHFRQDRSGAEIEDRKLVYRAYFDAPQAVNLELRHGDESVTGIREDTTLWRFDLPLEHRSWLLAETQTGGRLSLLRFEVYVYPRPKGEHLVTVSPVTEMARFVLNEAGGISQNRSVFLAEIRAGLGVELRHNQDLIACDPLKSPGQATGFNSQLCTVDHARSGDALRVVLVDRGQPQGTSEGVLEYPLVLQDSGFQHYLVGRAAVELAWGRRTGGDKDILRWDAQGAFFYRGSLGGDVRVIAGADASVEELRFDEVGAKRSLSQVGKHFVGHDARRIFRDLDPEDYYPTYGDKGTVVDERESGGRFFCTCGARRKLSQMGRRQHRDGCAGVWSVCSIALWHWRAITSG
ncbi:MAG: SdrD B-like domain-containing protein [Myxococcota bacterium]